MKIRDLVVWIVRTTTTRGSAVWRDEVDDAAFVEVNDEAALASWLERREPSLLLLHDPYCPISGAAYREAARLPGPIGLIDVAKSSGLSKTVEIRTGIRHESPQIILLRDGVPFWSASHYGVTEASVSEAVARAKTAAAESDSAQL